MLKNIFKIKKNVNLRARSLNSRRISSSHCYRDYQDGIWFGEINWETANVVQ